MSNENPHNPPASRKIEEGGSKVLLCKVLLYLPPSQSTEQDRQSYYCCYSEKGRVQCHIWI